MAFGHFVQTARNDNSYLFRIRFFFLLPTRCCCGHCFGYHKLLGNLWGLLRFGMDEYDEDSIVGRIEWRLGHRIIARNRLATSPAGLLRMVPNAANQRGDNREQWTPMMSADNKSRTITSQYGHRISWNGQLPISYASIDICFFFLSFFFLSIHSISSDAHTISIYLCVCVCAVIICPCLLFLFFLFFGFPPQSAWWMKKKKTTQPTTAGLTWISGMARTHSVNMWRWATVKNGKHTHTHIFMRANLIIAFDMWRIDKWEMIIWKLGMGSHREQTSLLCHCVATHMWLEWAHFVIILLSQQMAEYIFWWWYSNSRLDCCMLYKYPLHTTGNCWHPQLAVARERVMNDSSQATECDNETNSQLKFNLIKMKQGFWFEAKVLITFSSAHKRYAFIAGHLCASIGGKCHRACTAAVQR